MPIWWTNYVVKSGVVSQGSRESLRQLCETGLPSALQAGPEILLPLLSRAVRTARKSARESRVHARIARGAGGRVAGGRHAEERLLDVALLELTIPLRLTGKGARETIGGRLVLVRVARDVSELHRDRMSHLVRDDTDADHVAVRAERRSRDLRLRREEDVVEVNRVP